MEKELRPIVFVTQDSVLMKADKEAELLKESLLGQYKEIEEKKDKLMEEVNEHKKKHWAIIENRLKEINLFPSDYNEKSHYLCIKDGVIFMGLKDDEDEGKMFVEMLKRMKDKFAD